MTYDQVAFSPKKSGWVPEAGYIWLGPAWHLNPKGTGFAGAIKAKAMAFPTWADKDNGFPPQIVWQAEGLSG
ncbi:MAG: hypothetical protein D6722_10740 [Bacteroidetes bacterium]|nr:MAG: hypothetical protein D6722_10740 [Bacteroidota bacterium]